KTNFRKILFYKLKRDPQERRSNASQQNAPLREPIHAPRKSATEQTEIKPNENEQSPTRDDRNSTMFREYLSNPRNRSDDEEQHMQTAAEKRHARTRAEQDDQQNANASVGVNAEIQTCEGERESCAGERGEDVA